MAITCSLVDCEGELLGNVVMLAPTHGEERQSESWQGGFSTYVNQLPDGTFLHYLLLHQVCFLKVFNELMRANEMTALELLMGPIGLLAEEMGIPR